MTGRPSGEADPGGTRRNADDKMQFDEFLGLESRFAQMAIRGRESNPHEIPRVGNLSQDYTVRAEVPEAIMGAKRSKRSRKRL